MSKRKAHTQTALHVGARVRILRGRELNGTYGKIYNYLPGAPHPWHVRPETWRLDEPGVAFTENEIELVEAPKPEQIALL